MIALPPRPSANAAGVSLRDARWSATRAAVAARLHQQFGSFLLIPDGDRRYNECKAPWEPGGDVRAAATFPVREGDASVIRARSPGDGRVGEVDSFRRDRPRRGPRQREAQRIGILPSDRSCASRLCHQARAARVRVIRRPGSTFMGNPAASALAFGDAGSLFVLGLVAIIAFLLVSGRAPSRRCPRCRENNRDHAVFCAQCGAKLPEQ